MKLNITNNICRACLTEEGTFQSVFQKESSSSLSLLISEMLSACATIKVNEGDGLPEQICSKCSEQTVKMYLYKLQCEKSDVILRTRLEKDQAETVKIKNELDNNAKDENFIEDFKSDEFKCESHKEMCVKIKEQICREDLKEESKITEFKSEICQKIVNQDDLLRNQEIANFIKIEKDNEDLEIKYDSISPLLMESDSSFIKKENVDNHISGLNIINNSEMSRDKDLKNEQKIFSLLKNKPHGCDVCFEGFNKKSKLDEHMKTHTFTSKKTEVVRNKIYRKSNKCDVCQKTFLSLQNLNCHKRIHTGEKPYECDICEKKFVYKQSLTLHKVNHTGEKPFKCNVCKKEFKVSLSLKYHKRVHTGETLYKCDVCGREFSQLSNLNSHNRLHTGETPYGCEMCDMKFRYVSSLKSHVIIHTGVKPYECEVCKKRFIQLAHLNSHKKIHTGEKPYECKMCKRKFSRIDHLRRHKLIHTGEKPLKLV